MPSSQIVVHNEPQNCGADIADAVHAGRLSASDVHRFLPSWGRDEEDGVATSSGPLSDRHVRRLLEKARGKTADKPEALEAMRMMAELEQPVESVMSAAKARKR